MVTAVSLSVVVPARNAQATLGAQLDALLAQEFDAPFEVVVADNRSADGTRELVAAYAARDARVRLVPADERTGAAYCRNVGIAAARADAIVMCDADDVVSSGWIRALGGALCAHDFVTGPLELGRLNPGWLVASRGRALGAGPGDFDGAFPFAHSCNLGLRRDLVDRSGGFDERLPAGEDIELSHRLWRAGVSLAYVDEAVVHYRYRDTLGELWAQSRAYGRAQVLVTHRVRAAGTPLPRRARWRTWAWLGRHAGMLRTAAGRARWLWVAGGRVGAIEGAIDLLRPGKGR